MKKLVGALSAAFLLSLIASSLHAAELALSGVEWKSGRSRTSGRSGSQTEARAGSGSTRVELAKSTPLSEATAQLENEKRFIGGAERKLALIRAAEREALRLVDKNPQEAQKFFQLSIELAKTGANIEKNRPSISPLDEAMFTASSLTAIEAVRALAKGMELQGNFNRLRLQAALRQSPADKLAAQISAYKAAVIAPLEKKVGRLADQERSKRGRSPNSSRSEPREPSHREPHGGSGREANHPSPRGGSDSSAREPLGPSCMDGERGCFLVPP